MWPGAAPLQPARDATHGTAHLRASDQCPVLQRSSLPDLAINPDALSFVMPTDAELAANLDRRRFKNWPCEALVCVDLSELVEHIRAEVPEKSFDIILRGASRFFSLFTSSASPQTVSAAEAFKIVYGQRLVQKAMTLPLLNPNIYWTRVLRDGFEHLLDHATAEAEDNHDNELMGYINACRTRILKPLKKKLKAARDKQRTRRKDIDTEREKKLPTVEIQNKAAQQALSDLSTLHAAYLKTFEADGTLPRGARLAMNAMAYGVAAYRTFPGRPGEWSRMKASHMRECVQNPECWYTVITDHKTKATSGNLGRYLPPDVKAAFGFLLDFTGADDLLFDADEREENTETAQANAYRATRVDI